MATCSYCSLFKPWGQLVSEDMCRDCCDTKQRQRYNDFTTEQTQQSIIDTLSNKVQFLMKKQSTEMYQSTYERDRQRTLNNNTMYSFKEQSHRMQTLYDEAQGFQRRLNRQSCVCVVAAILLGAVALIVTCANYV